MSIIDWPSNLRYNHANIPHLERNIASAGVSVSGQERFISTDAGRWRYSVKVRLATRAATLAFRALVSLAEGRGNRIRVPILDVDADPAAIAGYRSGLVGGLISIPHSDGAYFSDGSGYSLSFSNGTASGWALAGATSISVTMPTGLAPEPGHFFSDGDNLYQVKTSTLSSGTTYDLTFRPRLRADINDGAEISFDRLYCLMRLADDDSQRPEQDQAFVSDADLTFVEALV